MNNSHFPPPQAEDNEMLRDAHTDLEDTGFTTLPPEIHPEQFIYWLERYRGLDEVGIYEYTETALILCRSI